MPLKPTASQTLLPLIPLCCSNPSVPQDSLLSRLTGLGKSSKQKASEGGDAAGEEGAGSGAIKEQADGEEGGSGNEGRKLTPKVRLGAELKGLGLTS